MKIKFFLITFLLLFVRGCDFYSTSLWFFQPGGQKGETNPLVSIFGLGWTSLVISNVIIIGLIIYAFYYYTFKYAIGRVVAKPGKITDFVSELYFNEKGSFYLIFFKLPKNKKILLGHMGYILIRVIIIGSILATIHNLCQFYNVTFYCSYREIVGRPLFVIYGIILLSFFYFSFRLWHREFEITKRNFETTGSAT
jgi:hypothetical protein